MADALGALDELNSMLAALTTAATFGRSKNLSSAEAQPIASDLARTYFEAVRPELVLVANRRPLVDEIDFVVQKILDLAGAAHEKLAYLGHITELRPYLLEATIDLMKARGTPRLVLSETEKAILDTLTNLLPSSAASYEQALRDISQGGRVSWRGPATELREALRETIDHFAPDDKVKAMPNFKLEKDAKGPTQKQKVQYTLSARKSGSAAVASAKASLDTVDEAVAALARSTYVRGSVSAHVGATAKEVKSLKRYIDALLADLLEIS